MDKNSIKEILTKIYEWAKGKGWNETVIKVVLGAIFGIICALFFTSCTINYENDDIRFSGGFITPVEIAK